MRLCTAVMLVAGAWSGMSAPKHIIMHVLDDIGFQDLGFQGAEFATPTLDAFAAESLLLARYYVQPVCTPTRAALLTARHPFRMGLQSVIPQAATAALPATEATLAEALRDAGSHVATALGKWHLGALLRSLVPFARRCTRLTRLLVCVL